MAVVVLAVGCGYKLSETFPHRRQLVAAIGQTAGVLLMIFGALANGSSHDPVWENSHAWFAAVCLPVFVGLLGALVVARLVVRLRERLRLPLIRRALGARPPRLPRAQRRRSSTSIQGPLLGQGRIF